MDLKILDNKAWQRIQDPARSCTRPRRSVPSPTESKKNPVAKYLVTTLNSPLLRYLLRTKTYLLEGLIR